MAYAFLFLFLALTGATVLSFGAGVFFLVRERRYIGWSLIGLSLAIVGFIAFRQL